MAKQQAVLQPATMSYKRARGLTLEQQNAVDQLVQGKSDQETAAAVGVNRVTVTKWRNLDPFFQAELNARRAELWGGATDRLRALMPKALDVLAEALDDPNHQLQAALQVVKLAGLEKLGEPKGQTDGDAILDGIARARWSGDPTAKMLRELNGDKPTEAERAAVLADLDHEPAED